MNRDKILHELEKIVAEANEMDFFEPEASKEFEKVLAAIIDSTKKNDHQEKTSKNSNLKKAQKAKISDTKSIQKRIDDARNQKSSKKRFGKSRNIDDLARIRARRREVRKATKKFGFSPLGKQHQGKPVVVNVIESDKPGVVREAFLRGSKLVPLRSYYGVDSTNIGKMGQKPRSRKTSVQLHGLKSVVDISNFGQTMNYPNKNITLYIDKEK